LGPLTDPARRAWETGSCHSPTFVGIDVAKDELAIHLHPTGMLWRVANSKTGLAMLGRKLTRLAGTARLRIGFEASGGYERKLTILLDRLALAAYFIDPARVRSFARAEHSWPKPIHSMLR
jgi:transposase